MSNRTWIVVPCYNEERRLDASAFHRHLASSVDTGFVLVNDGSVDGTLRVLRGVERRWPGRVTVVDQQPNAGKAEAVRVGLLHAMSAGAVYVGYLDADLATPLDAIADFVRLLDARPGIDLVLGARVALLGRAISRSPVRHYLGRVFATTASLVLSLPVYDTQCGAKLMRVTAELHTILDTPFGSRWIFDVELIARYLAGAAREGGIYEMPLDQWTDVGGSRVRARDFLRAGGEMAAIYRAYRLGRDWDALRAVVRAPFSRGAASRGAADEAGALTGRPRRGPRPASPGISVA